MCDEEELVGADADRAPVEQPVRSGDGNGHAADLEPELSGLAFELLGVSRVVVLGRDRIVSATKESKASRTEHTKPT